MMDEDDQPSLESFKGVEVNSEEGIVRDSVANRMMDAGDQPSLESFKGVEVNPEKDTVYDNVAVNVKNMMEKMGYLREKGLGKNQQGPTQPIVMSGGMTKHGLGHKARELFTDNLGGAIRDYSAEEKNVEEVPEFIESSDEVRSYIDKTLVHTWIVIGEPLNTLDDCTDYCDPALLKDVVEAKALFDYLDHGVITEARRRANPYETIMGGIFQNRAAMKTANLDKIFDWKLSQEFDETNRLAKNPIAPDVEPLNATRDEEIFYFADVCAGPGGFSEYMLWRKAFYNVKGFGFTLRGSDDFKLQNFRAGSAAFFETYYGTKKNGDVTDPENLKSLEEYVSKRTNGKKCRVVMCDGGFSVRGNEQLQEILSKRLYLCQFIVGLSLTRVRDGDVPGGNFLCKLFDVFTPFSAGLIYLMYSAFERISLHKPNTSRPANSERYIFCENLSEFGATVIKKYLVHINDQLDTMSKDDTILEIIPNDIIENDSRFFNYFKKNNEDFAKRQIFYLNKYREFSRDKSAFDDKQSDLRRDCLQYWEIPDKLRSKECNPQPAQMALKSLLSKHSFAHDQDPPRFTLANHVWREAEKQIKVRELCATLLPEYSAPRLMVSNERGEVFIFRSQHNSEKLDDLRLPPKTLLLVQETTLYAKLVDDKVEQYRGRSKVIFVIDAGRLNNDDISSLEYERRLKAIQKFCLAVNRGIESIETDTPIVYQQQQSRKRGYDRLPEFKSPDRKVFSYYLHPAEPVQLVDLERKFGELQTTFDEEKVAQLARQPFNFPDEMSTEEQLFLPCRALRVVKRYRDPYMLCWTNSNRTFFMFNHSNNDRDCNIKGDKYIASFFDHFPVHRKGNQPPSGKNDLAWIWSWQMDPNTNYGPIAILNDAEFEEKLTVKSLCEAIKQRVSKYPPEAREELFKLSSYPIQ